MRAARLATIFLFNLKKLFCLFFVILCFFVNFGVLVNYGGL